MPRFLCYCPDYPHALQKRLSVRALHLEAAQADTDVGLQGEQRTLIHYSRIPFTCFTVEGAAFLAKPSTQAAEAVLPEGVPNLAGSFMIYVYPDIEQCWKRIQDDAYWKAGVWDKERTEVWPLLQ